MWERIRGGTEWGEGESKSERERGREQRRGERGMRMMGERASERKAELAASQKHERLSLWILPLSQTCIRQARPPCPRTK